VTKDEMRKKPSCLQGACQGGMIKSNYLYLHSSEIPQVATYVLVSTSTASSDFRARVTHGIQGTGGPGPVTLSARFEWTFAIAC
jgi:hypothetical protein